MKNSILTKKYANKYLKAEEKWHFIITLLKKFNTITNTNELYRTVEKELRNLTKADECTFFDGNNPCGSVGAIVSPVIIDEKYLGTLVLKSNKEDFYNDNIHYVEVVANNLGLMLENLALINNLQKDNEQKMRFLACVSHEFKTPLNSIKGFADLMSTKPHYGENSKYLKNISNSSTFLLTLIQDILDVIRSHYKQMDLTIERFSAKEVIRDVIDCFDPSLNEKNVQLSCTLIDCNIKADKKRFRQVVYNLISNAIKFNDENGKINIITYLKNKKFHFEITDTGCGISKRDNEKIFRFFSQAGKDSFKKQLGSGVGLALCKTIIKAHKGEIGFSSQLHKGTTFWFSI